MALDWSKTACVATPAFQKLFLALEIRLRVVELRLRLLHGGARLFDLGLQRPRIDLRQHVAQLHLLTDGEVNGLQLPADLEGEAADVGRLQHAGKAANAALGLCRDLVRAKPRTGCSAVSSFFWPAGLQAEKDQAT